MTFENPAWRAFARRLTCFKVLEWGKDSDEPSKMNRDKADMEHADVVSSLIDGTYRHTVVLDIDHRAWLIPSTTEGHSHLYIDVPGGIPSSTYYLLLKVLADCGVIERGYALASIERGHSDVRLPWIRKPDFTVKQPVSGNPEGEDLDDLL